jgi:hypothetical protein
VERVMMDVETIRRARRENSEMRERDLASQIGI